MTILTNIRTGIACACISLSSSAIAENADLMVVFDASGSMWGQIDGKAKIEIAQEAFSDISNGWAQTGQSAGLIAYGHRRKGDCGDIELLSRPSQQAASEMVNQVAALQPKGKTPLSAAVRMAAETLKFTEAAATVILLSDGIETCDLDPCAVGLELEELGIDFTAHVIGFDIQTDSDRAQLQCLAENTGGQYLDANNAQDLGAALTKISTSKVEPKVKDAVAGSVGLLLAEGTFDPVRVLVTARNEDTGEILDVTILEGTLDVVGGKPFELPEGRYTFIAQSDEGGGEIAIDLNDNSREVNIPFAASGAVFRYVGSTTFGEGEDITFQLPRSASVQENATYQVQLIAENTTEFDDIIASSYLFGTDAQTREFNFANWEYQLAPGQYQIVIMDQGVYELSTFLSKFSIEVVDASLATPHSDVQIKAVYPDGTTPQRAAHWSVYRQGDEDLRAPVTDNAEAVFESLEHGTYEIAVTIMTPNAPIEAQAIVEINADSPSPIVITINKPESGIFFEQRAEPLSPGIQGAFFIGGSTRGDMVQLTVQGSEGSVLIDVQEDGLVDLPESVSPGSYTAELVRPDGSRHDLGLVDILPESAQNIGDHTAPKTAGEDADTMISAEELAQERAIATPNFEVWRACTGAVPCEFEDPRVALSFRLPAGWVAEEPFYYVTAGRAQASNPTTQFAGLANGLFNVALNPRQWSKTQGPCEDLSFGTLCRDETLVEQDLASYAALRDSLLGATAFQDPPLVRSWTISENEQAGALALIKFVEFEKGASQSAVQFAFLKPERIGITSKDLQMAPVRLQWNPSSGALTNISGELFVDGKSMTLSMARPEHWDQKANLWTGSIVNLADGTETPITLY